MRFYWCQEFEHEVRQLEKRRIRDIVKELDFVENLLAGFDVPPSANYWSNHGLMRGGEILHIYKMRMAVKQFGGKSSGPRIVYERIEIEEEPCVIFLHIYLHQDQGGDDQSVRKLLHRRIASYDVSSLKTLGASMTESNRK